MQLPPSLSFDASVVAPFLDAVRKVYKGPVCEPRHATWFSSAVACCWMVTESHESRPIPTGPGSNGPCGLAARRIFSAARITAQVLVTI